MKRLTLIAMLTACAMPTKFTPARAPAPQDAFAKTTRVLIGRGETIETKDEAAGLIVTKWEEDSGMGSKRRLRWHVTIENAVVTVNSQCQLKMSDPPPGSENEWHDCDGQPSDRSDKAKAIASEVSK